MRRFKMDRPLGKGAFGEVYAATMMEDDGSRRPVAVKLLHDNDVTEKARLRLIDEYRLLRELSHPSILQCYALTRVVDRPALITELIDGASLSACIKAEVLPFRVVVQIIGDVAKALHAAYHHVLPGRGPLKIVHRDVKTSNIQLSWDGRVVLLDFGIARTDALGRASRTQPGQFLGSRPYLAPEVLRPGPLQPSSDIFALGVTAFKALTKHPLKYDSWEHQCRILRTRASWAAYLEPQLATEGRLTELPELNALIGDMLGFEPRFRPTAEEVVSRCQALADALPGPELDAWAKARTWPAFTLPGDLSGKVFEEDPKQVDTTAVQVRPSAPVTVPEPEPAPEREPAPRQTSSGASLVALGCLATGLLSLGGTAVVTATLLAQSGSSAARHERAVASPTLRQEEPVVAPRPYEVGPVSVKPALPNLALPESRVPAPLPTPGPTPPSRRRLEPAVPIPTPMPAPQPITPTPAPTQPRVRLAHVQLLGDAPRVWLVSQLEDPSNGPIVLQSQAWIELAPGRYEVWSMWVDGSTSQPLNLEVGAGERARLRCSDAMELCGVDRTRAAGQH